MGTAASLGASVAADLATTPEQCMSQRVARRATVRGRVQGVFFRASTRERAEELGVDGWVRNDPEGSVTIHAEGPPDAVASLLAWAHRGPSAARVVGVDVDDVEPEDPTGFRVRR